ncbi:MAG: cupredoxin domain-containing protein [Candidatus Binatia bacterium]
MANREGGLRNAVVILRPLDRVTASQPGRLVLDNKRCAFVPHVLVATIGSELVLKNSDPILHTVHARIGQETLFNVGLPRWREVTKTLGRAGLIRIDCDVLHTWMSALIVVTSSPFYSITDENGYFAIDGLPTGAYDAEVWHEVLGTKRGRISVDENTIIALDVVYRLSR